MGRFEVFPGAPHDRQTENGGREEACAIWRHALYGDMRYTPTCAIRRHALYVHGASFVQNMSILYIIINFTDDVFNDDGEHVVTQPGDLVVGPARLRVRVALGEDARDAVAEAPDSLVPHPVPLHSAAVGVGTLTGGDERQQLAFRIHLVLPAP